MNTRVVVTAVAIAAVVTLYSLSELHDLSAQHASLDSQFATGSTSATTLSTTTAVTTTNSVSKQTSSATVAQVPKVKLDPAAAAKKCYEYKNTELWGDVVKWGTAFKTATLGECCDACRSHKPPTAEDLECNVFVWCGDQTECRHQYQQCWLKHLPHPEASKPARSGPTVPWTSGTIDVDITADPGKPKAGNPDERKFHTITTAQGTAVHWQARIHYYWFKKQRAACEKAGGCHMAGFTRLLHSGTPDDLVDEIPTVVVDPLPQDMVEHSWYVVLNRPYAFVQWVKKVTIPERYVLMSEPDHIFLRPMPNFMSGETPAAFPFFYIEPSKAENVHITQKFTGPLTRKQLEMIAPVGNSPTFMSWSDMSKTMPIWMNTSIAIFKDPEANKVWGWVQEMYGFTIAAFLAGIHKFDLYMNLAAQPPWDTEMQMTAQRPYYILHYTYGMDYKLTGEFTPGKYGEWRFDKRSYGHKPIPRNLGQPPTNMKNDLVRFLINAFNEATDAIPCWDKYHETGTVPKDCTEAPKHYLAEEAAAKAAGKH